MKKDFSNRKKNLKRIYSNPKNKNSSKKKSKKSWKNIWLNSNQN